MKSIVIINTLMCNLVITKISSPKQHSKHWRGGVKGSRVSETCKEQVRGGWLGGGVEQIKLKFSCFDFKFYSIAFKCRLSESKSPP